MGDKSAKGTSPVSSCSDNNRESTVCLDLSAKGSSSVFTHCKFTIPYGCHASKCFHISSHVHALDYTPQASITSPLLMVEGGVLRLRAAVELFYQQLEHKLAVTGQSV
eukprot:285794-Pelagomonas_calceolata.AAC.4